MFEMTCKLTQLRREHLALRCENWRRLPLTEDMKETFAFERTYQDERIVVVINREAVIDRLTLPLDSLAPQRLWGEATISVTAEGLEIRKVAPWSGMIIQV